jgi:hypothetical protein
MKTTNAKRKLSTKYATLTFKESLASKITLLLFFRKKGWSKNIIEIIKKKSMA